MITPVPRCYPRWPLKLVALLLAVAALWLVAKRGMEWWLPALLLGGLGGGLAIAAARLPDGPALMRWSLGLAGALRLAAFALALPELVASRLPVRWDVFFGLMPPKEECPIYYRMPDGVFDGGRFLKRTGPDQWTGRPLNSALRMKHSRDTAYAEEVPFTVRYDADGFRNPPGLLDWDALVAGDSFVELGSLPDGMTMTDRLAASTGWRVRNLGVASVGPRNATAFLRHFGRAPSCRRAIMVWGEIALAKTTMEWSRLRERRSPVAPPATNSLLRAFAGSLRRQITGNDGRLLYANATFADERNAAVPVMLDPPYPPPPEKLNQAQQEALRMALHEWAQTARELGMQPWLVFLPAKIRVWQGRLSGPAHLLDWQSAAFPEYMANLCREEGIHLVDMTAALRAASQQGLMVYNPVVDGHPTELGAAIIADTLAAALRGQVQAPRSETN